MPWAPPSYYGSSVADGKDGVFGERIYLRMLLEARLYLIMILLLKQNILGNDRHSEKNNQRAFRTWEYSKRMSLMLLTQYLYVSEVFR